MNARILLLRKELKLTQESFGNRLGVRKTAISKLEKGENNLTEQMFKLMCNEFNVNEEWLRDGTGEMFIETDSSIISELSKEYNLDDLDRSIIETYLKLDKDDRKIIKAYITSVVDNMNKNVTPASSDEKEGK